MKSPREVVDTMMGSDLFSQWLGISVLLIDYGKCELQMTVRREMLNGFEIAHGGITYSFSDSALAFSSNSHGLKAVSIETSISHLKQVKEGDVLIAIAKEISRSKKVGVYEVNVTNQNQELVSVFKGTVYVTDKEW